MISSIWEEREGDKIKKRLIFDFEGVRKSYNILCREWYY